MASHILYIIYYFINKNTVISVLSLSVWFYVLELGQKGDELVQLCTDNNIWRSWWEETIFDLVVGSCGC